MIALQSTRGERKVQEGGAGERRRTGADLRTQVAAHLLRADSNCFPYLLATLRHCLVGCTVWLRRGARECVCDVYLLAMLSMCTRERVWSYVTTPTVLPDIDSILLVHTVMLGWHWYSLTAKPRFPGGSLRKNLQQCDFISQVQPRYILINLRAWI